MWHIDESILMSSTPSVIHTLSHTFNVEYAVSYFALEKAVNNGSVSTELEQSLFLSKKDVSL